MNKSRLESEQTKERIAAQAKELFVQKGEFNDPLAYDLIPEEVREAFKQHLIESAAEMAPELAKECTDAETALRLAVRTMAGPVLARARFVIAVDFTKDNLASALSESKYDSGQVSFFSWMGVTHYLPLESVLSTLKDIISLSSSCSGSEIVFDYYDKSAFDPKKSSNRIKYIMKTTKTIRETIITGFDPSKLSMELALLGLRLLNNLGSKEIQQKYFKECNEGYAASGHVHLAHATW